MATPNSADSAGLTREAGDEAVHTNTFTPDGLIPALGRAGTLAIGAAGLAILSIWIPLLDRAGQQFVLLESGVSDPRPLATLPSALVVAVGLACCLGGGGLIWSLFADRRARNTFTWVTRWIITHRVWAGVVAASVIAGTIDFYELFYDPYNKSHGMRIWMLREDLQIWLAWGAVAALGLAMSALWPGEYQWASVANWWRHSLVGQSRWWIGLAVAVPCLMGAALAGTVLERVPHFSDSLTYLMQGRILHAGRLTLNSPGCSDLFTHSLFFIDTDGRYFGKYPIGWPTVLGMFDRIGLGYMANATLAGLSVVLTALVGKELASKRVAVLSAVLMGLSPWVWFNGANFASHVASACAVLGFVWLFLRVAGTGRKVAAAAAGLSLGAAVLVRPFDAAVFALPAIAVVLVMLVRAPKRWLPAGALIALGALVGVGIYMWVNAHTTGSAFKSAYAMESRWDSDWSPTAASMLGRLAFQWAELNGRFPGWGVGGLTVALLGAASAGDRWRSLGLPLLASATILFFLGCTAFGFTNVWWGPRWLFPVTPLLAILAAMLVDRILLTARIYTATEVEDDANPAHVHARQEKSHLGMAAAQLAMCLLLSGLMIGALARYTGQAYQHAIMPPHAVSAAVHDQMQQVLLRDKAERALVAMPVTGQRAPLDARAGLAFMGVPFEGNRVIYVRAIPDWQDHAVASYPGRSLYLVQADREAIDGFRIDKVQ